jgi:uncharacterized protein (TIGR02001 family)
MIRPDQGLGQALDRRVLYSGIAFIGLLPCGAHGADDVPDAQGFSGGITAVTDYRFRGVSQTQEDPAIQGGIEYSHPSGFTLGVWASNVDFAVEDAAHLETDIYGTYSWEFTPGWNVGAGLYYYAYPGSSSGLDYDYGEAAVNLGYTIDIVTFTGSLNYTPHNSGDSGKGYYPQLSAAMELPRDITLDGAIGRQWVKDNEAFALPDYTDWNLGLAYTWQGFTGKVQYIDTNLSKSDCAVGCNATGVMSVSKSF